MLSTCPSCLNQILHEDGMERVSCDCGESFSPFLVTAPINDPLSPMMTMSEKSGIVGIPIPEPDESLSGESLSPGSNFQDYSESEAAFAELRNFGENLGALEAPSVATAASPPAEQIQPTLTSSTPHEGSVTQVPVVAETSASHKQYPITAGDHLSGYEVEAFLQPVSIWCPATLESEDPLKHAHDVLYQRAQQCGANGVVSVRWSFTPDGTRILLTGTPVKCRKKS